VILRDVSVPGMTISKHTKFAVGNADCKDTPIISQPNPIEFLPRVIAAGGNGGLEKGRLAVELISTMKNQQPLPR